jgi:hypothetical protein
MTDLSDSRRLLSDRDTALREAREEAERLRAALSGLVEEIETDGGVDTSEWPLLDDARAVLARTQPATISPVHTDVVGKDSVLDNQPGDPQPSVATPRPWRYETAGEVNRPRIYGGILSKLIAEIGNAQPWTDAADEWEANAELIVNAVNQYTTSPQTVAGPVRELSNTDESKQQPAAQQSAEDVAREIVRKYIKLGVKFVVGPSVYAEWMKIDIAAALTAARAEGERAGIERAEQWHEDEAAICDQRLHKNAAEWHRDCAGYFRALLHSPAPETK